MIGSRSKNIVIWTFVAIALILLSAPTVVVLGASFTAGNIITFPPDGLSLKWYGAIAQASDLRQAFAGDVQLPGDTDRNRFAPGVEDIDPGIGDRTADRDRSRVRGQVAWNAPGAGEGRALGRAITVVQR